MLLKLSSLNHKLTYHFSQVIFIFGLLHFSESVFAFSCDDLSRSPTMAKFHQFLAKEKEIQSRWDTFSMSNFPVILFDSRLSSDCAVIIEKGKIRKVVQTSIGISLKENSWFSFINPWRMQHTTDLLSLEQTLKTENIEYGIVFDVNSPVLLNLVSMPTLNGAPSAYFELFSERPELFSLYVLTHESFHAAVQSNKIGFNWPQQREGMSRDNTLKCYSQADVADLVEQEKVSLLSLLKRTLVDHQKLSKTDKDFQAFVSSREKRYSFVGTTIFERGNRNGGCSVSEAEWEWSEGVADYFAFSTLLDAGYFSGDEIITYKTRISTQGDLYYFFGSSMLQILKNQNPNLIDSVINSIEDKKFPNSIYELFKAGIN